MARQPRRREQQKRRRDVPAVATTPVVGAVYHVKEVIVRAHGASIHVVGTPGMTLRAFCTQYTKSLGTWRYAFVNGKKSPWNYRLRDGDVLTFKGGPSAQRKTQGLHRS